MARGTALGSFFGGVASGLQRGAGDVGSAYWRGKEHSRKEGVRKAERQEILDIQQRVRESAAESQKMSHLLQSTPAEYRAGVLSKGVDWASSPEGQATIKGQWDKQKQEALDLMKTKHGRARELALIAARSRGRGATDPMQKAPYELFKHNLAKARAFVRGRQKALEALQKSGLGLEETLGPAKTAADSAERYGQLMAQIWHQGQRGRVSSQLAQQTAEAYALALDPALLSQDQNAKDAAVNQALQDLGIDHYTAVKPQQRMTPVGGEYGRAFWGP